MARFHLVLLIIPLLGLCLTRQGLAQEQGNPDVYSVETVLFVSPDSAQFHELEKELGDDFYTIADDESWYRSQGFSLLDSLGVEYRLVDRRPMRFFVDGEEKEYDWAGVETAWFVVLYDGEREPKVTASIDLLFDMGYLRP